MFTICGDIHNKGGSQVLNKHFKYLTLSFIKQHQKLAYSRNDLQKARMGNWIPCNTVQYLLIFYWI